MNSLEEVIKHIIPRDPEWEDKVKEYLGQLTMPYWALGKLMDLSVTMAGITRSMNPPTDRKAIVVMAADHGVALENVSLYPQAVTAQMVSNFLNGGAAINALARQAGAEVIVVDMGVNSEKNWTSTKGKFLNKRIARGTKNILLEDAMTDQQAVAAVMAGIDVACQLKHDTDVVGLGEMGIGNTTVSAAIGALITGKEASDMAGRGTGMDNAQLSYKTDVIRKILGRQVIDKQNGLEILSRIGGFEIAGLAGLILGCAAFGKIIVLDGFITTAAALIAGAMHPHALDYVIASHCSDEKGHKFMLDHMGKKPLLDLKLRLGEGSGAALMMNLIDASKNIMTQVATFNQAGVSKSSL